jgi:hypothetical protein
MLKATFLSYLEGQGLFVVGYCVITVSRVAQSV